MTARYLIVLLAADIEVPRIVIVGRREQAE